MALVKKLRRIALDRQGLLKTDHFGRGKQATLRTIEHLGYIQIDTISVVERAHHHVLWSRVSNYQPKFLEQLVRERKVFEYWFHAASWLPMRDYRFALPRMSAVDGDRGWFKNFDKKLNQLILERIAAEGPLRARDFEDTREGKKEWWDWKPAKQALEQLFMQGELMVTGREGFQKVYDLPERILPDWVDTRHPDMQEFSAHLIDTTLRAHGFATQKSMAYLRKGKALRDAINTQLAARVDAGLLTTLKLKRGDLVYINPEMLETRAPRSQSQVRILSPFDNAVIQRQRGRDIFGFDYQIECYVPEPKRQYGYFCLPVLYRDGFVGRIDCKAHRSSGTFEIKAMHIESQVDGEFAEAFNRALSYFVEFNACGETRLSCSNAQDLLGCLLN
jgi:uncharacterized protein YcaQ